MDELLEPLRFRNAKVAADLASEMIVDFGVPRERAALAGNGVRPPRVAASFAQELTAVGKKVRKQVAPLHTAIGSSS